MDKPDLALPEGKTKRHRHYLSFCVTAAGLKKISAHLVVLACLMIIAGGSGHSTIGQLVIFLLITLASVMHTTARALQRRVAGRLALPGNRS